jgi:hypothetical protein
MEFHVDINASLLVVGAILSQNVIGKSDQLVAYVYRLLNKAEHNYNTIKKEALVMVFILHKFKHYLLGNKIVFYVNHMALIYLVNKPQVLRIKVIWLLLFIKYDFIVVYKPGRIHVVEDTFSRLLDITKPTSVPNPTIDANLFYTKLEWLKDVKEKKTN